VKSSEIVQPAGEEYSVHIRLLVYSWAA